MRTTAFASPWPSSVRLPGPAWIWAPPRPFPVHVWLAKRASATPPAGKDAGAASNKRASLPVPPASLPARPGGSLPTPPLPGAPAEMAAKATRRQDAGATGKAPQLVALASLPAHPINLAEKLSALLGIPPLPPASVPVPPAGMPARPLVPPASLPARPVGALPTSPSPVLSANATRRQDAGATNQPPEARLDLELRLLFSRASAPLDEDRLAALHIELGQRAWSLTHTSGAPRPADPAWPTVPRPENALEKLRARLVADVDLGLSMVELSITRFSRPVRNVMLARQAKYIGHCLRGLLADPEAGTFAEEWEQMMEGLRRRR